MSGIEREEEKMRILRVSENINEHTKSLPNRRAKQEQGYPIPDLQSHMRSLCINYALQGEGRQRLPEAESAKPNKKGELYE